MNFAFFVAAAILVILLGLLRKWWRVGNTYTDSGEFFILPALYLFEPNRETYPEELPYHITLNCCFLIWCITIAIPIDFETDKSE